MEAVCRPGGGTRGEVTRGEATRGEATRGDSGRRDTSRGDSGRRGGGRRGDSALRAVWRGRGERRAREMREVVEGGREGTRGSAGLGRQVLYRVSSAGTQTRATANMQ